MIVLSFKLRYAADCIRGRINLLLVIKMALWNNKAFTENELSWVAKTALTVLIVIPVCFVAVLDIIRGEISHPFAFV